ncbi:MAG: Serine-tRNA ligase [Candidatus Shapirobacteria bacterium GW2011_GWE1_38_10]|uniref:Serine--tRNA ligase n=1 Tax=Candidatus Shapirobacteria bacterium GW2011_GWE1_38_10 TaxID=1618488 RepID=A0A0G0IEY5_9BACT|nr:MAG: Serine-tRNA ligase [Candidatus Shapirobacteria bacterium GW2011_GWF2_37_20]KKQ49580.1 MAG: Serine-tRNA ligase [Candidatus Shapirobacteria bacterium GW2011_GWE1_38_10]KKQ63398.1 MAG: Serine-tRNA ligase [Candidatus Shapirobacteria bacterium GW2011_GWF1_38_23]HBP51280.1 serine--tRNA ligase [Candidatus Shapirobacteria bacterium]
MIDINLLRENPETIKKALQNRQKDISILEKAITLDKKYLEIIGELEALRAKQNQLSKSFKGTPTSDQISEGKVLKDQIKIVEEKLLKNNAEKFVYLEQIPNIPANDVPVGKDESDNVVIKTVGEKPVFDFTPKDHIDLGEALDILDVKKAAEVSGSRFGYFKGQGAVLEMSLMFYAFQKLVAKGFVGMIPPTMVNALTEWKCGYTSNKNLFGAYYSSPEDNLIFISSSEHSVVPYHMDEVLNSKDLPIKYVNYSPCFRREAGTYGKDMKGMLRVHNFNKVEMNIFTLPDLKISDAACLEMLAIEEEIMQELGLHYQVVQNCTGDLPQPNRRMYDTNTWFPGQNAFRETQSCSNCSDYQARRLNTKVKIDGQNTYVHILNATVVTDRVLLAILENFQTKDGSINIPEVLWPFTGFKVISPKL